MNSKSTGSFYTPHDLVIFMLDYIKFDFIENILEPSVGDGRFIDELIRRKQGIRIDAVDLIEEKVEELKKKYHGLKTICLFCSDFIKYAISNNEKYDLIIGNPPYINKKSMTEETINNSLDLINAMKLDEKMFKNIWVSFIIASIKKLNQNGIIFFVLPFEFLQVNYAKILRNHLEEEFSKIEIITFEKPVFPDIEQEVCLVFLKKGKTTPYIKYCTYDDFFARNLISETNIKKNKPLEKWSNSILSDEEIDVLNYFEEKLVSMDKIGEISPGIVTGANAFFIVDKQFIERNRVQKYCIPIISKAKNVKNKLIFSLDDFALEEGNKEMTYLLKLGNEKKVEFPKELQEYIEKGELNKINERYKCSKRNYWYSVPIVKNGDLFFFKRYHKIPKLYVNKDKIYTTDMCYNVRINSEYDSNSLAFCFYNSVTIALCEFQGRFYGGGVCELTPKEFKRIAIPYKRIEKENVLLLNKMIEANAEITDITDFVDRIVFNDIDKNLLKTVKEIREKYIKRRI